MKSHLAFAFTVLAAGVVSAAPPTAAPDTIIIRSQTRPVVLTPNPLANDSDPDGTPVSFVSIVRQPQNGTVVFKDGQFTYDPGRQFAGEDSFSYRIVSGGELATGEVTVRNPFLAGRGVLATGFPATDANNGNAGYVEFRLNFSGAFTARLAFAGQDFRFKGSFNDAGTYTGGIAGNTLTLSYPVDGTTSPRIDGLLTPLNTGFSAPPIPYGRELPSPQQGRFTLLLPLATENAATASGQSRLPQGLGFATVRGSKNGRLSLVGRLGDGQRWSSATFLAPPPNGTLPVYAVLRPFGSNIFGRITFTTGTPNSAADTSGRDAFTRLGGTLQWLRIADRSDDFFPEGFQTAVSVVGSSYRDPGPTGSVINVSSASPNAEFMASGGDLNSPKTENATLGRRPIAGAYEVSIENTRIRATMRIEPRSGYFSGRFRKVAPNRYRRFSGVFVQSENLGGGVFDVKDKVGRVNFTPKSQP
jgi:hypothetical protein